MRLFGVTAFRLTTAAPQRLVQFYEAISFSALAPVPIPSSDIALLGLEGRGTRIALTAGNQRLELETFDQKGRPYPENATAADLCFQHFALVTTDAAAAWECARLHGATPISRAGPVTLPPLAGGVTAVKFRDPEGHPLEFLQFPSRTETDGHSQVVRGIDHSAISVSNAGISRAFYERLGLKAEQPMFNHGPTQVALDGLPKVRVAVVPMRPDKPKPHLELLGYERPLGRPAGPFSANDIASARIVWEADRDGLLRDPDAHMHVLRRNRGS